jgi:hypothetical protein
MHKQKLQAVDIGAFAFLTLAANAGIRTLTIQPDYFSLYGANFLWIALIGFIALFLSRQAGLLIMIAPVMFSFGISLIDMTWYAPGPREPIGNLMIAVSSCVLFTGCIIAAWNAGLKGRQFDLFYRKGTVSAIAKFLAMIAASIFAYRILIDLIEFQRSWSWAYWGINFFWIASIAAGFYVSVRLLWQLLFPNN